LTVPLQLEKDLCQRFCPHFKPSKKEELACLGFLVIERLIERGIKIPIEQPAMQTPPGIQEALMTMLCPACPFFQEDCDFVQLRDNALPCGGFRLLEDLIHRKIIPIDIIREIR
jgi:hypothetical protein